MYIWTPAKDRTLLTATYSWPRANTGTQWLPLFSDCRCTLLIIIAKTEIAGNGGLYRHNLSFVAKTLKWRIISTSLFNLQMQPTAMKTLRLEGASNVTSGGSCQRLRSCSFRLLQFSSSSYWWHYKCTKSKNRFAQITITSKNTKRYRKLHCKTGNCNV